MKIEQLEQLIKIVESSSMNIAAREMYVARSSLSTSMKHLEAELDAIVGLNNPLYKLDRDEIELQELSSFTHLENYAPPPTMPGSTVCSPKTATAGAMWSATWGWPFVWSPRPTPS